MNAASDRNGDSNDTSRHSSTVKISESTEGFKFVPVDWTELEVIPYEKLASRRAVNNCRHAAHGMLYTKTDTKWLGYRQRAWILMQMRFDGSIGFPGGMVDDHDETIDQLEIALARELKEEAAIEVKFTRSDHVVTHYVPSWNIMLSFYCKEITLPVFLDGERRTLDAEEYGKETLGIIRPPLYNMVSNRGRTGGGFATFIRNKFPGNALLQLLMGLKTAEIFTKSELLSEIRWSLSPQSSPEDDMLHGICDFFERHA